MNTDFADLFDILNEGQEFEPCFMKVMVQSRISNGLVLESKIIGVSNDSVSYLKYFCLVRKTKMFCVPNKSSEYLWGYALEVYA